MSDIYTYDRRVINLEDIDIPEDLSDIINVETLIWSFNGNNQDEICDIVIPMILDGKVRAYYVYQLIDAYACYNPLRMAEISKLYHQIATAVQIPVEPRDISKTLSTVLRHYGFIDEKEKYEVEADKLLNIFTEGTIPYILAWDQVEKLQQKTLELGFYVDMIFEINEVPMTLLEISAKYAANECFNFLIANGASYNATLPIYAIEGGSFSIIHFCEQQNLNFDLDCYRIAIQSHKNNIADWLLNHYQCAVVQIIDCVHYRNTLAALFSYYNGCDIQFKSTELNETCFTEAAKCENFALAKFFRSKGAEVDINLGREPGESPLIRACRKNNYELIQFLLDLGADVNFVAGEMKYIQYNAIAYACNTNNYEMTKFFIERHADVNSITIETQGMRTMFAGSNVRFFKSPLWITCMWGYFDIVKLLVENGANINQNLDYIDKNGKKLNKTALSLACRGKFPQIAEYLIDKGADINVIVDNDETVLSIACEKGFLDVVKVLVSKGANINQPLNALPLICCCSHKFPDIARYLVQNGANINLPDKFGVYPLTAAIKTNSLTMVKEVVELGADIKMDDFIKLCLENKSTNICKYLVSQGARITKENIFQAIDSKSIEFIQILFEDIKNFDEQFKNEVFLKAFREAELNTINYLTRIGYRNTNFKKSDLKLGLFNALRVGTEEAVNYYLSNGADVNTIFEERFTPLSFVCFNENMKLLEFLVKKGADVNLLDVGRLSPLCYSLISKYSKSIEFLLQNGANQNDTNVETLPLVFACKARNQRLVMKLIESGANVNISGLDGVTPIDAAKESGIPKIIKLVNSKKDN